MHRHQYQTRNQVIPSQLLLSQLFHLSFQLRSAVRTADEHTLLHLISYLPGDLNETTIARISRHKQSARVNKFRF